MRIIVLVNLKEGVDPAAYEAWVRDHDYPGTRALPSVTGFETFRTLGNLGGGTSPYQYVEVIDIVAMEPFMADVATAAVQTLAAQFGAFADNPQFMVSEVL